MPAPSFPAQSPVLCEPAWRFIGAGTPMRDLVRRHAWELTPLGPVAGWPTSLRAAVGLVLHAAQPSFLWWGEQLVQVYNDAAVPCLVEDRHPAALGQAGPACWGEHWAVIGPQVERVLNGGAPQPQADHLLPAWRNGRVEDVYWRYACTPVFDEHDSVAGVLAVCTETTAQVLAARRRQALDRLAHALLDCGDEAQLADGLAQWVAAHPHDLAGARLQRGAAAHHDGAGDGLVVIHGAGLALVFQLPPRLPLDHACRQFLEQATAAACAALERIGSGRALALALAESERLTADLHLSTRIKDEFLALLGHELRNPLAPIVTALKLMKLRGADSGQEQAVIQRQVEHLVRLVDDLLDVSRIASGRVELRQRSVPLADVIHRGIDMASPLLEQKRHHLRVEAPAVRWHGDPERLAQVLSQLLSNAARYTPAGGHISLCARLERQTIRIEVSDDGRGIAPELLPHVFDLFVQGRRQLERARGGLGVGLALVRNLVQLHGGTVSAHSDGEGCGSTFTITLPEAPAEDAGPAAPPRIRAGASVLVVDDNRDAADTLSDLLGTLDYRAAAAYDPAEAIAAAAAAMPQVAILDIGLPGMDGYELAAHLRRLPGGAGLRLVALSGYSQPRDRERSRQAGFAAHLVKPLNLAELQAALNVKLS